MKYFSTIFLAVSLLAAGCSSSGNGSDAGDAATSASFTRLDKVVTQFPQLSPARQHAIVDSLTVPLNDYIYLMGASTGDIPASIDSLSHTAAFAMFEPEVDKAFPSTAAIEKQLGTLDANIRHQLPTLPHYSYYGIISPYRQQVMLVDSVIYVALNHYLGAGHEAYSSMPEYTRATKTPTYIPLDIAEAIVAIEYPFVADSAPTAIQYFLYEGALLKAVADLTGITDTATLMGWTSEQLAQAEAQQGAVWRKMAADNIIYSTDMSLARRLCAPAPSAMPVSPTLPGRICRYIGYRIVDSYLANNPGTSLSDLLSPTFYNSPSTLINSGYSPK